jgi:very-short-patch-repair endonuclease
MKYTKEEINFLEINYGKIKAKIIAKILNRSQGGLEWKARELGLHSNLGKIHFLGKKHTKKTLKIMSRIKIGKNNPFWHKKHTPKYKKKIGQLSKERWVINKEKYMKVRKKFMNSQKYKNIHARNTKRLWKQKDYREKVSKAIRKALYKRPTLPEKQVIQIIKLNNLPFKYVGDGKRMINGFNPDFIYKRKIIEVFSYHHTLSKVRLRDRRKKRTYKSLNYQLLVIWEHQIKRDPQKVTEKIVNFYLKP